MNSNQFSEALENISEPLIDSAAHAYENARPHRRRNRNLRRIAAIAAIIAILMTALLWPSEENYITGPGVLVVRAYELDEPMLSEENSTILEEGITLPPEYIWKPNTSAIGSGALGLPLLFSVPEDEYPGKEITFEVMLSGGDFEHLEYLSNYFNYADSYDVLRARYLGLNFTIPNSKTIYWRSTGHVFHEESRTIDHMELDANHVFVDIIVYADSHIIGYAVIEIYNVDGENEFTYNTRMLKSVSFPQVQGTFQNVSYEYVKQQIEVVHKNP